MKVINFLILLSVILLFSSCRQDEFTQEPGTNPIPFETQVSTTGNLTGLVIDEDNQAISGAVIELNGLNTISDENGIFNFEDAVALTTGSLVKVEKDGYYDGFKFTSFITGQNSLLKVKMVSNEIIETFQSSEEVTIDVNGAELYLPANIVTRADGSPFNSYVGVKAHWYDPTDANTIAAMPGDLRGVSTEGVAVQLATYGMMAVELVDETGSELKLKDGMTATMTFPLPGNSNGPDEIPMWHLDEESGVWVEEGKAVKIGSAMVAEVSHFSFWNCDDPFDLVKLTGRILSGSGGAPVTGLEIIVTDNDEMISGYGYTNSDGVFCGLVPSGNDLTLSMFNCGAVVDLTNLGILTEDTDIGDIDFAFDNQLDLSATLVDCFGTAIEDGIALINTEYSLDLAIANNGQINHTLFPCGGGEGTLQGVNNATLEVSEAVAFDLAEQVVDLDAIEVCGALLNDGITFSFKGAPAITLTDATVSIVDDIYLHIIAEEDTPDSYTSIEIRYFINGASLPDPWSQNRIIINGKFNDITYGGAIVSDPITTSESISGFQVGDSVTGSLANHPSEDLEFVYKFKIDQVVTTPQVTGHIWMDTNGDGIRDAGENDPIPNLHSLKVSPLSNNGVSIYYYHYQINPDGSYCIKGLLKDQEYNIRLWLITDQLQVTSYQEGTDATVDNDYFFSTFYNEYTVCETNSFSLGDEEILPNIGLGLIEQ